MSDTSEIVKRGPGRPRKHPLPPQSPVKASAPAAEPTPAAAVPLNAAPLKPAAPKAAAKPAFPSVKPVKAAPSPADHTSIIPGPVATAAPISEGITSMATIAPSAAEAAEKVQAMFGDATARMKTAFEKSTKASEEMVEFAKGNVEALVQSARIAAKAGETLGQEAAEYSKRNFETASAALKSFASVKSPSELFQLQSDYAKSSFDSAVAEASKLSEAMMKALGDIAQPLSSRYALAAEKIKSSSL